jgi:hypothetical protein
MILSSMLSSKINSEPVRHLLMEMETLHLIEEETKTQDSHTSPLNHKITNDLINSNLLLRTRYDYIIIIK